MGDDVYGLALETLDVNRGYFARTASAVLGRVVSRYQAGNALAWARAARAAGLGVTAARTAYLSPRGLTNPERKVDIATRVAAALVAAHAGMRHDLVVAAYLSAGSTPQRPSQPLPRRSPLRLRGSWHGRLRPLARQGRRGKKDHEREEVRPAHARQVWCWVRSSARP